MAVTFTAVSAAAPIAGIVQIMSGSETAAYFSVCLGTITTALTIILKKNRLAQARITAAQQIIAYHLAYNRMEIELLKTEHEDSAPVYLDRCSTQLAELFANDPVVDSGTLKKYHAKLRESGIEADQDFAQLQALVPQARVEQYAVARQSAVKIEAHTSTADKYSVERATKLKEIVVQLNGQLDRWPSFERRVSHGNANLAKQSE